MRSFYEIIWDHPSPQALRHRLATILDELVRKTLPVHADALRYVADRIATPETSGLEQVDGIQKATEMLMSCIRDAIATNNTDNALIILGVLRAFVGDWGVRMEDEEDGDADLVSAGWSGNGLCAD